MLKKLPECRRPGPLLQQHEQESIHEELQQWRLLRAKEANAGTAQMKKGKKFARNQKFSKIAYLECPQYRRPNEEE